MSRDPATSPVGAVGIFDLGMGRWGLPAGLPLCMLLMLVGVTGVPLESAVGVWAHILVTGFTPSWARSRPCRSRVFLYGPLVEPLETDLDLLRDFFAFLRFCDFLFVGPRELVRDFFTGDSTSLLPLLLLLLALEELDVSSSELAISSSCMLGDRLRRTRGILTVTVAGRYTVIFARFRAILRDFRRF